MMSVVWPLVVGLGLGASFGRKTRRPLAGTLAALVGSFAGALVGGFAGSILDQAMGNPTWIDAGIAVGPILGSLTAPLVDQRLDEALGSR